MCLGRNQTFWNQYEINYMALFNFIGKDKKTTGGALTLLVSCRCVGWRDWQGRSLNTYARCVARGLDFLHT